MASLKAKWKKSERLIKMEGNDMDFLEYIKPELLTALTQGVLVSGASVYANQIFKQFKGDSSKDSDTDTEQK